MSPNPTALRNKAQCGRTFPPVHCLLSCFDIDSSADVICEFYIVNLPKFEARPGAWFG